MKARITTPLEAGNPQQWAVLSTDPPATVKIITVNGANAADGYLVARYDRALLELLLSAEKHDAPGRLMLTDPNGRVLAAVGGEASESEFFDSPAILRQQGSAGAVMDYANAAGIHSLAAWLPLATPSSQDWMLVIAAPFASAFAPAYDLVARIFLADLVIILLFITVAYRITSRMLRPIENLSEGARLASSGKFGQTISDPGTHDEIGRLTRAFNEMMGKLHESQSDLQSANNQLKNQNGELQKANEVLSQLSITDGLTKLHNHRYFQEILIREIKRQTRTQKPLSMLLVDLDDFKTLNDRLGHASGDELLMRVASIMDASVRDSDLLARYGGEEFVVLATDTDLEGAVRLAEKIRMAVEQARHIVNDSLRPVRITVSVGVAQYSGNRRLFFESADRALYRAKDQGKNCVIAAAEDGPLD
jgi:diguanylate cyclase (GGDEF)-like protein